jgi:TMEM175 potassium channel family protein
MDTRRAEAFSDGVFAVAITVLVFNLLEITLGKRPYQSLADAWPQYFAYVVSFLTIGIMWMNHHTILGHVKRVDRPLLVINLLLLMGVVAIPFPTALVADHLQKSGGAAAAVSYGVVMVLISVGFAGLWIYVVTHAEKLGGQAQPEALRQSIPGFTGGLLVYVAATVIAAVGLPVVALIIYGVLAVYYLFEHLPAPAEGALPRAR